jgi:hypothetical protein
MLKTIDRKRGRGSWDRSCERLRGGHGRERDSPRDEVRNREGCRRSRSCREPSEDRVSDASARAMTDACRQPNDLGSDHQGAAVPIGCDALLSEPLDGEVELVWRTRASRFEPKLEVLGIEELDVVTLGSKAVTRYEKTRTGGDPSRRRGAHRAGGSGRAPPSSRQRSACHE